ncbi:MAG TPA: hypothetical protein VHF06_04330 [Pseudonocardiaceae bacterium]|nr:hypothetical protein [Pseudonocardiaceae bacterium]
MARWVGHQVEAALGHERKRDGSAWLRRATGPAGRAMLVGFAAMLVVFSIGAATAGPRNVFLDAAGVLAFAILFGAVPTGLVALSVSSMVRRRRRHTPPQVTVAELQDKIRYVQERIRHPQDVWDRMLGRCEAAVRSAGEAVALAPGGPSTDWLRSIHARMEQELANAATLARLARTAFPQAGPTPSPAARSHPLHEQLSKAVHDFETSKQTIVDIVARLVRKPDLDQVRSELAMLEVQLPVLSGPDLG